MRDKIVEQLEKHQLIKELQHGFVRKKSSLTNLLVFLEEIADYLDYGYSVDVIYLDFQSLTSFRTGDSFEISSTWNRW